LKQKSYLAILSHHDYKGKEWQKEVAVADIEQVQKEKKPFTLR
jgi:hypothetical protein